MWREDQKEISVYTDPYFTTTTVAIIREDKSFPVENVEALEGKVVGTIRGYQYPGWTPELGGYTPDEAINDGMLFEKFAANRYDVLFNEVNTAKYYAKELDLDIVVAKDISETDLSFRLHVSKTSAIGRFNDALGKLKKEGVIDAIVRKYTE